MYGTTTIKRQVRAGMHQIADALQRVSRGRITPNGVTWLGLFLHIPVAVAIATGYNVWAATGLIVFGLLDTLDGELARLQGSVSDYGGFLDASTDRIKEVLLYSGAAYWQAGQSDPRWGVLAVLACGFSLGVSYVKAKGEAIVATRSHSKGYAQLNRLFSGGFFPFEVRMLVLASGLAFNQLLLALCIIVLGSGLTMVQRLIRIGKQIA